MFFYLVLFVELLVFNYLLSLFKRITLTKLRCNGRMNDKFLDVVTVRRRGGRNPVEGSRQ